MFDSNNILTTPAQILNKIMLVDPAIAEDIVRQAKQTQADYSASKRMELESGSGFIVSVKNALRGAYNLASDIVHSEPAVHVAGAGHHGSLYMIGYVPQKFVVLNSFVRNTLLERVETDAGLVQAAGISQDEISSLQAECKKPVRVDAAPAARL